MPVEGAVSGGRETASFPGPRPLQIPTPDGSLVALHDFGGKGEHILFSHATGMHGYVFRSVAERLSDSFHCWSVDLRGHGDSPAVDDAMPWPAFGRDIEAAVGHIGGDGVIGVGHSLGGSALMMAAASPGTVFSDLLLFEPAILPATSTRTRLSEIADEHVVATALRRRSRFATKAEALENYARKRPTSGLHVSTLLAYVDHGLVETADGSVELKCRPEVEAASFRSSFSQEHLSGFERVHDVRIVMMTGTESADFSRTLTARVAGLMKAPLVELDRMTHLGPLEAPAHFADVIRQQLLRRDLTAVRPVST